MRRNRLRANCSRTSLLCLFLVLLFLATAGQVAGSSHFKESLRACAPGCETAGNCNGETGTCECPFGLTGARLRAAAQLLCIYAHCPCPMQSALLSSALVSTPCKQIAHRPACPFRRSYVHPAHVPCVPQHTQWHGPAPLWHLLPEELLLLGAVSEVLSPGQQCQLFFFERRIGGMRTCHAVQKYTSMFDSNADVIPTLCKCECTMAHPRRGACTLIKQSSSWRNTTCLDEFHQRCPPGSHLLSCPGSRPMPALPAPVTSACTRPCGAILHCATFTRVGIEGLHAHGGRHA